MRNGKLRHNMTLQEPVTTQDTTTGEMVTVWTEVAKVWASLEPLSANAFVAAGAEQSEVTARVTIRYREGVTSKMRLVYRGMYYDIKGVLADPKSGLEYLTLPVGEGVRYENPTPPAPPVCAITLTGDIAASFGGTAMSISGQTASYTLGSATTWAASQAVQRSKPASGTAIAEVVVSGSGGSAASAVISDSTYQFRLFVARNYTTGNFLIAVVSGGSTVFTSDTSPTADYALGVNSDGDPAIFIDGSPVDLGGAGAGMFAARDFALLAIDQDMQTSGAGSIQFVTTGASFARTYPALTRDWCDNPL